MAVEYVSLSRDNSLEELRVAIEEKKGEVKMKFMELKKLLEISENTATNRLDRIYTDVKEGIERSERTVTQLEKAKNALNSTLVDNDTILFLQTTNQNIDDQIAKARNSACVVPKHTSLRWSIEELKQSIEDVCEVISSSTVEGQKSEASSQSRTSKQTTNQIASYQTVIRTLQTELAEEREKFLQREELFKQELAKLENQNVEKDKIISFKNESINNLEVELGRYAEKLKGMIDEVGEDRSKYEGFDKELEGVRKELQQRTKELVSLQQDKLQMQLNYQNEISNLKSSLGELNYNCSSLKAELQKQSEFSKHALTIESANTEDRITSLTTRIRELKDELTTKDTYISRLHSELEKIRIEYLQLEKELQTLKLANKTRSKNEANWIYSNTNQQRTSGTVSKVEGLEAQLTLKNSVCEDLQRKVVSLQSNLREAQDMLAAKLESPKAVGESVHLSLPPSLTRKDYSYKTSQSADVDYVRIPKKQMEEYETNTRDLKSEISQPQKQLESKQTETVHKVNLDDSREELENIRLRLQQTQRSNSTKVQSKRDSLTGTVVEEKQAHNTSKVVSKHNQQSKYTTTELFVKGKYSQFYTLSQVVNPSQLVGELTVCKAKRKHEYVIGTLKVVISTKLRSDKATAGIEFTEKFGDCTGSYKGIPYFKTNYNCAVFIPTAEVYISYNESPK